MFYLLKLVYAYILDRKKKLVTELQLDSLYYTPPKIDPTVNHCKFVIRVIDQG